MTNLQIVVNDAIAANIFTPEQIDGYLSEGDLPLKTFKEWKNVGCIVKRGEQARLKTRLWQPKKSKGVNKKNDSENDNGFVLVPAYLFTSDQVVMIDTPQAG